MSRLFESLKNAADGAFVVNEDLRIDFWNKAAEQVLGFESGEVADQFCYQILRGTDDDGRLICESHCRVAELALKDKPVPNYDISMRTKQGDRRWVNINAFTYRMGENGDNKMIVHLFRDINHKKEDEKFLRRLLEAASRYHHIQPESEAEKEISLDVLTPRQRQVLTLLSEGHGTREIGQLLSISPNTVRNHVQHILQKLHVKTRLEAVTFALKHGLVD
jgi:PAS domain S-box-containing protein